MQGCYRIKLGKKLSITFLPNEERLYAFHCPRSLLNYQADSRLHRSHVLEARRTSRFQFADANNEDNHEYVYYLCATNLHDLSDRPLDRNTHVVSIPESPRWQDRTEQHTLITSESTRAAYVLHHPYSVLVYRFSFVHGRSSDNESYLRDGTLRRAAGNMRDFMYYVYSLHYDDPLPGQLIRINIDQYLIHVFQNYHTLRNEDYPLLSTNLVNPDAAARDIPSPIPIFDISTSVDSITASFRIHHWLAMVADADSYTFPFRKIFTNYDDVFVTGSTCRTVFLIADTFDRIRLWFHYVHTTTTVTGLVSDSYHTTEAIIDLSCPRCTLFVNQLSLVSPRHWFSIYSVWRLTTAESPTTIVLHN